MAHIIILGGGLTGLSTAYHLEQRGFFDYTLFEKDTDVGGLCRSIKQDGFTFDYTGHLLHASDDYFRSLIMELVGQSNFNSIQRRSFIYSHGTYTKYPFQINLFGLPDDVIVECIEGFANKPSQKKEPKDFPSWVLKHFGAGIAKHFFFPFQSKIFAHDLENITSSWMGRFVPKTSLQQMLRGALSDYEESVGYNSHFYYPKQGGINHWITKLAQRIHNKVYTQHCVQTVDLKNKMVTFSNGHTESYKILINTLPLDTFLGLTQEPTHSFLKSAQSKLLCNSVINFNLGINRADVSDKHWIYFPENKFPFYRVGFAHNFAASMAPEGCSSLYGEFSHIKQTRKTIDATVHEAIKKTKELFALSESDIIVEKIIEISHAYVIFDFWREKNLHKLLGRLEEHDIYSIGRYGGWKYSSMQEGVLDGKQMAEKLTVMPAKKIKYTVQKKRPSTRISTSLNSRSG